MKRKFAFKSLLSLAVAGTLFCGSAISAFAEDIGNYKVKMPGSEDPKNIEEISKKYNGDLSDKVVILSTNDTHGAILQFAYFAALKNYFADELNASEVLLVDSGDFCADKDKKDDVADGETTTLRVADYKQEGHLGSGKQIRSINLMNAAGYDYACLGNHEISSKGTLQEMLNAAKFKVLDANIHTDDSFKYSSNAVAEFDNLKIGFFGLDTHEIKDTVKGWSPKKETEEKKQYSVDTGAALIACAQSQVDELKGEKNNADLVICLSHLGMQKEYAPNPDNAKEIGGDRDKKRSIDLWTAVNGIDLMLDGHSHTAIFAGENNEPIMSGQIWGNYLGIIVIDKKSKEMDRFLISDQNYESVFGTTSEERVSKLNEYGAGDVINLLEDYTGKDAETLFDYDYDDDDSSNDKNHDKNGKNGRNSGKNNGKNNGKNGKNDKNSKNGKHSKNDRNSKSNSRFGKRSFEYDEEDFELEEDTQAIEDASTEATTADENAEITSEANDESSTQLDEQSTDAASTDDSTEATEQTDEQDNAEQSEDAEVDPAA
ncbi:metallophosphoesterase [Butyrivibrio sp. INlla21]|uniref:metallophosphoesterase n=1 Tax=Butyrivibrio sp. INlla21 TaxID=1520811 RepID=UPI0008E57912|nr:metallophosphoesterase [Butyrivibrio sp. INlla21]SFU85742.1 hypothetical protein SAMN02910342_02068 [Butyrivibrio sp. INlla21]